MIKLHTGSKKKTTTTTIRN